MSLTLKSCSQDDEKKKDVGSHAWGLVFGIEEQNLEFIHTQFEALIAFFLLLQYLFHLHLCHARTKHRTQSICEMGAKGHRQESHGKTTSRFARSARNLTAKSSASLNSVSAAAAIFLAAAAAAAAEAASDSFFRASAAFSSARCFPASMSLWCATAIVHSFSIFFAISSPRTVAMSTCYFKSTSHHTVKHLWAARPRAKYNAWMHLI